ncbi:NF-kappa-B inhibitor delta isoform X2 [Amia ocellicauda]|uniref:NF-kappa-B inhibitor delta isoform X2 n=1 Tax=Amia ocellicauda TaxID=2972642 RepID=UPI003463A0F1
MHWEKSPPSEHPPRPYQGVRVKEPVKDLLKRKRGNRSNIKSPSAATVVVPHTALSAYPQFGHASFMEVGGTGSELSQAEDGAICTGWLTQPTATTLQPMTHWTSCPEYLPHDQPLPSYSTDMYVQPVCPSYTVVGPSSVLTYTHTPLFTNFGTRNPPSTTLPQADLPDSSLAYFPWAQPLAALPAPAMQCPPGVTPFTGTQLLPLPITVPEPDPERLEQARSTVASLPIEKLLEEDDDKDTILHIYVAKEMREYAFAAAEKMRDLHRIDAKEHHGKTPLLVAVAANQPYILHDLIGLGADVNVVDDKGQTALHLASIYGYLEVIQVILSTATVVNLEVLDFEGHTPLHCAVLTHNAMHREVQHDLTISVAMLKDLESRLVKVMDCIKLLVQGGACVTSQDIKSNKSVLHLAVQEGNYCLLKFFLELNAGKSHDFINLKAHGNTALHMAAGLRNEVYQEEIVKMLLSHGAEPSIRNLDNDQPVHLVQPGEEGDRIRQLLRRGKGIFSSSQRSSTFQET